MNKNTIFAVGLTIALFIGAAISSGCNTWRGMGRDVERVGELMQGD